MSERKKSNLKYIKCVAHFTIRLSAVIGTKNINLIKNELERNENEMIFFVPGS